MWHQSLHFLMIHQRQEPQTQTHWWTEQRTLEGSQMILGESEMGPIISWLWASGSSRVRYFNSPWPGKEIVCTTQSGKKLWNCRCLQIYLISRWAYGDSLCFVGVCVCSHCLVRPYVSLENIVVVITGTNSCDLTQMSTNFVFFSIFFWRN